MTAKNNDPWFLDTYGATRDDVFKLNNSVNIWDINSPAFKFYGQKNNAIKRNVPWNITFTEWMEIWVQSGKFDLRGRGNGYCMARNGDSGAYEKGNVYICTSNQNVADSHISKPRKNKIQQDMCNQKITKNQLIDLLGGTAEKAAKTLGYAHRNSVQRFPFILTARQISVVELRMRAAGIKLPTTWR